LGYLFYKSGFWPVLVFSKKFLNIMATLKKDDIRQYASDFTTASDQRASANLMTR
jgi:hypothetical protein